MSVDVVEVSSNTINVTLSPTEQITIEVTNQSSGGGVSDHGALTGLSDDDHSIYHTDARGDARYYLKSAVDTLLGNKENSGVAASLVSAHSGLTNNPHSVTKSQVGLGNVDNTSDVSKPLSTAMINALAAKARHRGINSNYSEWNEDFNGSSLTSENGWGSANSGGSAGTLSSSSSSAPVGAMAGVCIHNLGSANGHRSAVSLPGFFLGNGYVTYIAFRFSIEALATVGDDYWYNLGFNDVNTALDCNYGAYLQYNRAVSPNWYIVAANGGVVDKIDTGIVVKAGATTDKIITLELEIAADASNVKVYNEGTLITTLTSSNIPNSNIPTNASFKGMRTGTPANSRFVFIDKVFIARYIP
jgi:hypothetical protein